MLLLFDDTDKRTLAIFYYSTSRPGRLCNHTKSKFVSAALCNTSDSCLNLLDAADVATEYKGCKPVNCHIQSISPTYYTSKIC